MESLAKFKHHHHPLHLYSLKGTSFTRPIYSISLNPPSKPIRILNSSSPITPTPQNLQKISPFEPLNTLSSLLKATCITIATASLVFTRFTNLSIAAPIAQPRVESSSISTDEQTEEEKLVEECLDSNSNDVNALRTLMVMKVQERKVEEVISILDQLIKIRPLYTYYHLFEKAKVEFEEVLKKDPFDFEAYYWLAFFQSEPEEMEAVMKRIEVAMKKCESENRKEDCRDFKMLLAEIIKFKKGNTNKGAFKFYKELVPEDPEDFLPQIHLAIIILR